MTGVYPPVTYVSFQDLKARVMSAADALSRRDVNQYICLKHVVQREFESIEQNRDNIGSAIRFTYFPDIETLIVKVPSKQQEKAHATIGGRLIRKVARMGVGDLEFQALGATQPGGWPLLVVEAGVSESMPRLRCDASWWISNSNGEVQMVLIIEVSRNPKKVPQTQVQPGPVCQAHKVWATMIDQQANPPMVLGAPLRLEFYKVIGRPAIPLMEHDIVFTSADLLEWSRYVFI
ncbi:hypothetical protein BDV32DRAFT_136828 [Aspergillus pseudonomiae]|uniref:Uncharacterized protein n=1 Tax=Aspergillus pseudonomiae TaxID=1506151 RepID=A0A5N6I8L6_9EURO|nr:uncharacterized protein BDV37DRAFT_272710 [Aspergillus pseudonomiae]KAB8262129.1 hypothetical protein BDV32DRAFT_136828 [Aspergillus pseudonomiae]KAE8402709.1 hypothetical protein BDV37DRAFT_272710 [Aspergillus pseudonomiae]